ncbi:MAG: type II secretion system F family protein [Myxococcota bacterium]|jgi:type IV pilus assembly protein PilC|nr:type II secretion system F family protein [Myxococcota bacterium]
MPSFSWEARSRTGEIRKGTMTGNNEEDIKKQLRSQNLIASKIKKKGLNLSLDMQIGGSAVKSEDLVTFTRQFATMVDAGLPMLQCLDILSSQASNPAFRKVLTDVKNSVEGGQSLADSLKKHPKVFDKLFTNMISAGETGGVLDTILNRLATYIEKNSKLVKQFKGAMVYPAAIVIVSTIITLVLLIYVIPMFESMFAEMGATLPALTQTVVNASILVRTNIGVVLGLGAFLGIGGYFVMNNPKTKILVDRFILYIPIFGDVIKKVAIAKFTRTFGTMLASGVPILEALDIVAGTAGNSVVEEGLLKVKEKLSEGKTMAQPLGEIPVFPPMVVQMISIGEATGSMDTMLNKIADFYDDEVDNVVTSLMSLLEPMIMVGLAVVLGGLVIAMYLPVFEIAASGGAGG